MKIDARTAGLYRREFDTAALMRAHPPAWYDANKRVVAEVSCPPDAVHHGRIVVTRWSAVALPSRLEALPPDLVLARTGFYDYRPVREGAVEWHVNFADARLFFGYAGGLFAQDELQVAEHPALGAIREAMLAEGVAPLTETPDGQPTPVLITGVERRVAIATAPDIAAGRPDGLYGNAFAVAEPDVVRRATRGIEPPTVTNLIAMAAPAGGYGSYTEDEIRRILVTALTGLQAAVFEAPRLMPRAPVVVHTGYWGCGAFGGSRVLMAALQVMAAGIAGLDRLVFHAGPAGAGEPLREAASLLRAIVGEGGIDTDRLISQLVEARFAWGVGDGS